MMTKIRKKAIKRAFKSLSYLDDRMYSLVNDPMTEAMGCPISDFAEAWGKQARTRWGRCLKELQDAGGCEQMERLLIDNLTDHI